MIIYLILGIIMCALSSISMLIRKEETIKSMFLEPAYWVAMALCVIFWPIVLGWGIYDGIQLLRKIKRGDSMET